MIKVVTILGEALFDDEDWDIAYHRWGASSSGYLWGTWKGKRVFAQTIVGERHGLKGRLDHEDRNKINNQFNNLREATKSQNGANRDKQANNTSGCKGIRLDKRTGKWVAQIRVNGILNYLGSFINKANAEARYREAARKYQGDFAFKE